MSARQTKRHGEVYQERDRVVLRLPEDPTVDIRRKIAQGETPEEAAHLMLASVMSFMTCNALGLDPDDPARKRAHDAAMAAGREQARKAGVLP